MVICRYFQSGYCRFGDSCRNEHVSRGQSSSQSQNRFGALNSSAPGHSTQQSRNLSSNGRAHSTNHNIQPYSLERDVIRNDLTADRPMWILSCYGPGRQAPIQLFGGPEREQSFEERRLRFYELASHGKQEQALIEQDTLLADAERQMQSVLNDIDGAIAYVVAGANQHPNRIDICNGSSSTIQAQPQTSTIVAQKAGFGQPSSSGTPFGAFASSQNQQQGLQHQNQGSFGRPSTFGSATTPEVPNPFAQAAAAQQTPPNLFSSHQGVSNQSSFGQPTPSLVPAFDKPSNGLPSNPFDQAAQNSGMSTSNPLSTNKNISAVKDSRGVLMSWKGKRVSYIDNEPCFQRGDRQWERIWFPDGTPLVKEPDLPLGAYDGTIEQEYKYMREHGKFAGGKMPDLPPKKEWCKWDF